MPTLIQLQGIGVRPATPADVGDAELLARWSDKAHVRFQLECLPRLIGDGRILLATQGTRLCGLVYATIDYPNSAIRGLVVRPGRSTGAVVEAAMAHIVPAAQTLGALSISYIGDDPWLVPALAGQGFERQGQIIGMHRAGAFIVARANGNCQVRPAGEQDIEAIVEADWSAFETLWRNGQQTVREFMAQMPNFLVASEAGRVQGYACGTNYGQVGHIVRLAVHERAQRQGIGTRLVRELLSRLSSDGARSLSLNTQRDNRGSQAFYGALGFHPSHSPTSVYRCMLK